MPVSKAKTLQEVVYSACAVAQMIHYGNNGKKVLAHHQTGSGYFGNMTLGVKSLNQSTAQAAEL